MQPDVLVVCDLENNVNEKGKYMGTPDLVIEILSDSTRSKDMVDKLNTYMISGVKEFWIIDPNNESILIYSFKEYEISEFTAFKKDEIARSFNFEGLEVKCSEIFGI